MYTLAKDTNDNYALKALLNLPQSHFDSVNLLNRVVRLREPKLMNCTTSYKFCPSQTLLVKVGRKYKKLSAIS
ncbi:hypothetical protein MTR_8g081150 [Medicago truncatula]|uniref:Uncharacterized protein n=1 Tax=Medicago truncatula TaxID=3880 RepID=A0A072TT05_MEDTR|nr:hypothetical protein MTR_8g081150 [Medicago truncatula]